MRRKNLAALLLGVAGIGAAIGFSLINRDKVGETDATGTLVPTYQRILPDGEKVVINNRPVDSRVVRDRIYLKDNGGISVCDVKTLRLVTRLDLPGKGSLYGMDVSADGKTLLVTGTGSELNVVDISGDAPKILRSINLPSTTVTGASYPQGVTFSSASTAWVCLNRDNAIAEVDIMNGKILRRVAVDVAPYALLKVGDEWVVSCWGTRPVGKGAQADASGTKVAVDARGISLPGSLVFVNTASGTRTRTAKVGSQPTQMIMVGDEIWTANANDARVTATAPKTGRTRTVWKGQSADAPNGLLQIDETVFVACGGRNAVVALSTKGKPLHEIRSGWFPTALAEANGNLLIAASRGIGSRSGTGNKRGVYDFTGVLSSVPATFAGRPVASEPVVQKPRPGIAPVPIPERVGEPSVFKHVIYILKENRTYDQVFGAVPEGDGDPSLAIFGPDVAPNHHAIAKEFVLLDNFYCNGILSADGHSWATEGNAGAYFQRAFGGWTRSYPYGDDPLAISSTGHIWDAVLAAKKTFRNFGEYDYATPAGGESHAKLMADYLAGKRDFKFKQNIGIARLKSLSHPDYPGWNMGIPDVIRASVFIKDLKQLEAAGKPLPSLSFVYLPQDHLSGQSVGMPTPRAHMADNDLAVGQILEALSKSKYWKETVVFTVEDDAQDGFDHVDGHRSPSLVASPYTRRGAVVSQFYNQTSVLRTIRHILGVPPMNRFDRDAPLMDACFTTKPDFRPYALRPARVSLEEVNRVGGSGKLSLGRPDATNPDVLNRQIWAAMRPGVAYPVAKAGAHGKGLAERGLTFDGSTQGVEKD